jgi:hypothetical protein
MEVTLTIRYRGPAARAGALVTALEREGVRVDWTPPQEQRGLGADATAVVLSLVASGAYDGIKAAVTKMREWMPRAEIVIENDPGDADAEPLSRTAAGDVTPETIAQWMVSRLEQEGRLYQSDAVSEIAERFGDEFTYENDNGNPAIDKRVTTAFRKITGDTVVWERWDFCWRKREAGDTPGRKQE